MRDELKVMHSILEKITPKFPNVISFSLGDFEEEFGMSAEESNQYFFGWFFCEYCLFDGKSIISLIKESLELSGKEKKFIQNIEDVIIGYFEIVSQSKNEIVIKDLLTKKNYSVAIVDLDYKFKKKDVIEAKLAKNFDEELFFFGGFLLRTKERKKIMKSISCYFERGENE